MTTPSTDDGLHTGTLVKWTPPPEVAATVRLFPEHPGEVSGIGPRDVDVRWAARPPVAGAPLSEQVSLQVFDAAWLTPIDATEYAALARHIAELDDDRHAATDSKEISE